PEAKSAMDRFQALRATNYAVTYSQAYLEQGRYAEAIASTGAEPELVDQRTPDVAFTDVTSTAMPPQRPPPPDARDTALTLADLDGDGHLDLIGGGAPALDILRNDRGRLVGARSAFASAFAAPAIGAIAGDYDNDGRADLLVVRQGGVALYRQ